MNTSTVFEKVKTFLYPTQRKVLALNMLILFLSLSFMACFSLLISFLFRETANSEETIFYNWLVLGLIEICMSWVCVIGIRGVHLLSFEMLLLYFWGVTMFFGPLILAAVAGLDFYLFIEIWFRHSWHTSMFAKFRSAFCESGTANAQCMAPHDGGVDYANVTAWCMASFDGQTDCADIREAAESEALDLSRMLILIQGCIGMTNCVQIGLTMFLCYHILSAQVITKSMNDSMNYLLMLPIAGCVAITWYSWWMRDLIWDLYWVPDAFLLVSIMQVVQVPLGIAGGRLKAPKILMGCILLISLILCALALLGFFLILYAISWQGGVLIQRSELDDIACINAFNGCCCCEKNENRCPEWSADEIVTFMVIALKIFGMVAFISMIYYFGAVSVTDITRKSLRYYRCEYI